MTGKIIKITIKPSRYGGEFYYLFFKCIDGQSYKCPTSNKFGNFRRWYPIINKFQREGHEIWLTNLLTRGKIIDADSMFSECPAQTIAEEPRTTMTKMSDEEFIKYLKENPAYQHVVIDDEIAKMHAWLMVNPQRKMTRRFMVNWLNRIEKPVVVVPKREPKRDPACPFCDMNGKIKEGSLRGATCLCVK